MIWSIIGLDFIWKMKHTWIGFYFQILLILNSHNDTSNTKCLTRTLSIHWIARRQLRIVHNEVVVRNHTMFKTISGCTMRSTNKWLVICSSHTHDSFVVHTFERIVHAKFVVHILRQRTTTCYWAKLMCVPNFPTCP